MDEHSNTPDIPVIGIGASAGGLQAFEVFFKNMPSGIQAAIVIIQHLDPNHESILADIVNRYTAMDVFQIEDGVEVQPGKIYIIPPNKEVTLQHGKLVLAPLSIIRGRHLPVDTFFKSLKEDLQEKAIAVILSGTGSDGTLGIREIKEAGGLTLVQSPNTAQYDGMPISAIKTGLIDFIIPVNKMPEKIIQYIENEFQEKKIIQEGDETAENYITQTLELIRKQTGHDFTNYKRNTLERRIERRLTVTQANNLKSYVALLRKNPDEVASLYRELLISVTSFFRDPDTFHFAEDQIIPQIVSQAKERTIRVWVPACATGEEAYSWAITLNRYLERNGLHFDVQVFASDIDVTALEKAREGHYTENIVADVPPDVLDAYLIKEKDGFRVKKSLRELIIFAEQNVVQDPPYSRLDLVSCRNFLIYLDPELQQKAIAVFHYALNSDGFLVLGNSEALGSSASFFKVLDRKHKVFQKIENTVISQKVWNITQTYSNLQRAQEQQQRPKRSLSQIAQQIVLERFMPPSLMIDQQGEILYVQGHTGKYLEISTGEISHNILKVAREGLKIALANAIRKTKTSGQETIYKRIKVTTNGDDEYVDLTVSPITMKDAPPDSLLVVFRPAEQIQPPQGVAQEFLNEESRMLELEQELADKEEYLQSTIEELETANEELKASNEEAQSVNEELQSTNEELETSKEELQSVNEELVTTNSELQHKVEELGRANSLIKNLLASTQIATIFLDTQLRIFQFTPAVSEIVDLRESDIGRSITQFTNNLDDTYLIDDLKEVLDTQIPKEKEVSSQDQRVFWMRIIPYRTLDEAIEGVVITFTDISEKKKQEAELEKYRSHLEELVSEKTEELQEKDAMLARTEQIACIGSWRKDVKTDQVIWSEQLFRMFQVNPNKTPPPFTKHLKLYPSKDKQWLQNHINAAIEKGEPYQLELTYTLPDGEHRHCVARGEPELDGDGRVIRLFGSFQDITDRKHAEEEMINLAKFPAENPHPVLRIARDGKILYANEASAALLEVWGCEQGGHVPADWHTIVSKTLSSGQKQDCEVDVRERTFSLTLAPVLPNDYINIYGLDITDRKRAEEQIAASLKEKEVLLQEIHHRVKNNMQTIASLLYIQQQHTKDECTQAILNDSIQRVKSMAMIHEHIYHSESLAQIKLAEYIRNFANKLWKTYRQKGSSISLTLHIDEIYLPVDKSIPVALILNELITNALKYAFPDRRSGDIRIECRKASSDITLIVADNGVGLPEGFDITRTNTIGLYLVYNLATKQLGGSVDIPHTDTTEFVIRFKE